MNWIYWEWTVNQNCIVSEKVSRRDNSGLRFGLIAVDKVYLLSRFFISSLKYKLKSRMPIIQIIADICVMFFNCVQVLVSLGLVMTFFVSVVTILQVWLLAAVSRCCGDLLFWSFMQFVVIFENVWSIIILYDFT